MCPSAFPVQLSLAVIVKDEEELLGRLLDSHRGLMDEAVVVDTGSSDRSVQVAGSCGARVIVQPWRDDFSEARNRALQECRGRWILVLDCDESIAPEDFDAVRKACLTSDRQAWVLPQWNYTDQIGAPDFLPLPPQDSARPDGARGYVIAHSIRLFPNVPALRYEGVVHETLEPAAVGMGMTLGLLETPIRHFGHLQGPAADARRRALYGRLLRRKIRGSPGDPRTRRDLAVQLVQEGNKDLARRLLGRTVSESPRGPEVHRARLLLGRLLMEEGDLAGALVQFETAVRERPDWGGCWVDAARINALLGDQGRAALYLREGRKLFPRHQALCELETQVLQACAR